MKKVDIILALITGEAVAWLFVFLLKDSSYYVTSLNWILPIAFPFLALLGIWIASLIGETYLFVYQLAKFLLIGALFAVFDLAILNSLMIYFGITEGLEYTLFVAFSFMIATTIKYVANKYWAFEKKKKEGMATEFSTFFAITLISGLIQVGVASLIVNSIGPSFGVTSLQWGNIGKIGGIIVASAWNFLGYKFIVFKK